MLHEGDVVKCAEAEVLAKQTKPPAHYSDATLLRAMETAGRLVEDDEAAEAMKESGLGTPATRAATIERLIDKEYLERQGRTLRATDRSIGLISALGDHALASPAMTARGRSGSADIENGRENRVAFMHDITSFTAETVAWFADKDRSVMRAHRRVIGPCPNGDGEIVERPLSYSCTSWKSKTEPGCGYQIWKRIGGRVITPDEAAEFVDQGRHGRGDRRPGARRADRRRRPCPSPGCGGQIVERERSFGCTSYHSKDDPGCGFVIWKKPRGKPEITVEMAQELLRTGELPAGAEQGADRRLPDARLWRQDRREQPRLRVHVVEEPQGARLRVRHLEDAARPRRGVTRAGHRDAPRGQLRAGRPGRRRPASRSARARPRAVAEPSSRTAPAGAATRGSRSRSPAAGSPSGASSRAARSRATRRSHCSNGARPSCPSRRPTRRNLGNRRGGVRVLAP